MKKIICVVLCLLLVCLTAVPAMAAPEAPEITLQPQNYHYLEYSVACYTVKASGSNLSCTWYLEYEGNTYNLSDNTNAMEPWEGYAGANYGGSQLDENTFMWFFGGIESGLNGAQIWCVIEDGHYDVTSDRAIITIQGDAMPPEILEMPAALTVNKGDSIDIRCLAKAPEGTQLEYIWYETTTGQLPDIRAISPEETGDFLFVNTETVGVRYYVCGITTSAGGRAYSSVVPVTVIEAEPEETVLPTKPEETVLPTEPEETVLPTEPDATAPDATTPDVTTPDASEAPVPTENAVDISAPQPKPAEEGFPWWGFALISLVSIAAGIGVAVLIMKKKK